MSLSWMFDFGVWVANMTGKRTDQQIIWLSVIKIEKFWLGVQASNLLVGSLGMYAVHECICFIFNSSLTTFT